MIFTALKGVADETFEDACNEAIANNRSAPMLKELAEIIGHLPQRRDFGPERSTLEVLKESAARTPNREFANGCTRTLDAFLRGKISREQFFKNCDEIDQVAHQLERGHSKPRCSRCDNEGWVTADDEAGRSRLYRCSCPVGSRVGPLPYKNSRGEVEQIQVPVFRG